MATNRGGGREELGMGIGDWVKLQTSARLISLCAFPQAELGTIRSHVGKTACKNHHNQRHGVLCLVLDSPGGQLTEIRAGGVG